MKDEASLPFGGAYQGAKILLTGHTGFKGSWLAIWLERLGAKVTGYSLEPPTTPSNFEATALHQQMHHVLGDVRDFDHVNAVFDEHEPVLVFHLAAQAILPRSIKIPRETFETNVTGTVNVLEAVRRTAAVKGIVIVTSDKCYEEQVGGKGYQENDRLGGRDPYSASKGMAELAATSYRITFFDFERREIGLATARSGNVIGGGDFGEDRLVPDCVRALEAGKPVLLRAPASTRPWQFVLEPLSGYLQLGAGLLSDCSAYSEAWNFGPDQKADVQAKEIAEKIIRHFGSGSWTAAPSEKTIQEAEHLRLDWSKAASRLNWKPCYDLEKALAETMAWYKAFHAGAAEQEMYELCVRQIEAYLNAARDQGIGWA